MTQPILQDMLNQLQTLKLEELQQLDRALQQHLTAKESTAAQTAFDQALLDSGLVKQIKHPIDRQINPQPLVQIQGKPLSETIIEERR